MPRKQEHACRVGRMYCPRKRSGSMPAVQARPRRIRGAWHNNSSDANYQTADMTDTVDVGQYDANPWGFFDMHGNVFERVRDYYVADLGSAAVTDPKGANSGSRAIKGGSWYRTGDRSRSAYRSANSPDLRSDNVGFRLAYKKIPHVVELNSTVDLEMIWVEPGTFTMGQEGWRMRPEHNVTLTQGILLG